MVFFLAAMTLGSSADAAMYFPYGTGDDATSAIAIVPNIPDRMAKFLTVAMLNGFTLSPANMADIKPAVRSQSPDSLFILITRPDPAA